MDRLSGAVLRLFRSRDVHSLPAQVMVRDILALLVLLFPSLLRAQPSWFPLSLPWDDASKTVIDASELLLDFPGQNPATVIDSRGPLIAGADGHFYFENTGRRARFWGVNFTFNANFPPCPERPPGPGEFPDDRVSDKVARRLAKLGINVVRFHHMDFYASPNGIFDPRYYPNDTQHLDEAAFQRLDYLIYQLRQNGIYVNLNLKVARHFGPGDGLEDTQFFKDPISFFQGVSHFNPRMIELQQDYARRLLTHRNAYTGLTYAEDPVVAFIEIANEDSMFGTMLSDGGLNYLPGVGSSLPERYSRELDTLWNSWLAGRYGSQEALSSAWKSQEPPVDSTDRMRNGGFESGMNEWSVYPIGSARVAARTESGAGPDGSTALRVDVTSDGINWHVQCVQNGHAIEKDRAYEITFYARASIAGEITLDVMKGAEPWSNYGLSKTVLLSTVWQKFSGTFRANTTDRSAVRPTFELGARDNTIWIDKVEFRQSAPRELEPGESLPDGSVRRPSRSELGRYTPARVIDLFRFYSEVDAQYFGRMRTYVKDTLGARAMVTGTAPWWAYLGDVAIQSEADYVDGHYYWDHPWWPAGRTWQPTGWNINNKPWINELQSFGSVASQAVEGKPFTVSEFNEVFPNRYALEGPLLISLLANLQDWDAVYLFSYAGNTWDFARTYSTSFFDIGGNPVKLAQMPVCARIFLGAQNTVASGRVGVELNREELALGYAKGEISADSFLASKGLDQRTFLESRLRVRSFDRSEPVAIDRPLPAGSLTSSNREMRWNVDNPQAAYMRIDAPGVQGAIGFIKGFEMHFGDWQFNVGSGSPDHMAVILQSRDRVPLRETRRMILSIWTEHQNTGMVWNEAQTSVDDRWGGDPPIVRPAQVEFNLRLPALRTLRMYPLDEHGSRREELAVEKVDDGLRFQLDTGRDRSVWYEIEINEPADGVDFTVPAPDLWELYTDGAERDLQVGWMELENTGADAVRPTVLLEYRSRGVLTSVVRLPASSEVRAAHAPVIQDSQIDTAVALVNRQAAGNIITLSLIDADGSQRTASMEVPLRPGETTAFFVREKFTLAERFEGLLELSGSAGFHFMTLRSIVNASGDFALTPYPQQSVSADPLYFAHLTADSDYSTDILLWNSQAEPTTARLSFYTADGAPAAPAGISSSMDAVLKPGEFRRITMPRSQYAFYGYAQVTLVSGASLPAMTAVITRWENGAPASEAGIPATPAVSDELVVLAERPHQNTGIALLNPASVPVVIDLVAPEAGEANITLAPGEKKAFFLYEVLGDLPACVTSMLHLRASLAVAALALAGITNERGDFLMASLTGEPGTQPLEAGGTAICPRYATGDGYRTLIFMEPEIGTAVQVPGRIRFLDSGGVPQPLLFR